jgi:spermidine/putrescine transport system permease protein
MSPRWLALKAWTALVYLFLFLPILTVILMSFNASKYSIFPPPDYTLRWYAEAAQDPNVWQSIKNSLLISVFASLGATAIGTLAAMGFVRNRFMLREVLNVLFLSPMIIPEIITGIALLSFATVLNIRGGVPLIIIGHILIGLPFVMTVVSARLHGFDASLEEAAMDLGANEVMTFRRVTMPLIMPGIAGGALLAFTISFDNFMMTYLLAGTGVMTVPVQIYSMVRFEINPKVHALSAVIVLLSMLLIVFHEKIVKRREP